MTVPSPFVPGLGQTWHLPAGVSVVSGPIVVPAGTHVVIDGTLGLAPKATGSLLHIAGPNVLIEGCGTLNGNQSTQTGPVAGIDTAQVQHVRIRDLTITNFSGWPVNIINRSSDVRLSGLTLTNSSAAPEFANGSFDCWADNLYVTGINDYGFCFYGGVYRSGLTNSILRNSKPGCGVLADDSQPGTCHDIIIANNVIEIDPTKVGNVEGIFVTDNTTGQASPPRFVSVTNNVISGGSSLSGGQTGATGTFTCLVRGTSNAFAGNTVYGNTAEYALLVSSGNWVANNNIVGTVKVL